MIPVKDSVGFSGDQLEANGVEETNKLRPVFSPLCIEVVCQIDAEPETKKGATPPPEESPLHIGVAQN